MRAIKIHDIQAETSAGEVAKATNDSKAGPRLPGLDEQSVAVPSPALLAQARLQDQLAQTPDRPLPLTTRLVVIVGGTASLWAGIIGLIAWARH